MLRRSLICLPFLSLVHSILFNFTLKEKDEGKRKIELTDPYLYPYLLHFNATQPVQVFLSSCSFSRGELLGNGTSISRSLLPSQLFDVVSNTHCSTDPFYENPNDNTSIYLIVVAPQSAANVSLEWGMGVPEGGWHEFQVNSTFSPLFEETISIKDGLIIEAALSNGSIQIFASACSDQLGECLGLFFPHSAMHSLHVAADALASLVDRVVCSEDSLLYHSEQRLPLRLTIKSNASATGLIAIRPANRPVSKDESVRKRNLIEESADFSLEEGGVVISLLSSQEKEKMELRLLLNHGRVRVETSACDTSMHSLGELTAGTHHIWLSPVVEQLANSSCESSPLYIHLRALSSPANGTLSAIPRPEVTHPIFSFWEVVSFILFAVLSVVGMFSLLLCLKACLLNSTKTAPSPAPSPSVAVIETTNSWH